MQKPTDFMPLVAILGPTASGKSSLAIDIARQYGGEIISVDSRQVYRGMDVGTGKVIRDSVFPPAFAKAGAGGRLSSHPYSSEGIPHHLIDVADPLTDRYNVTDFLCDAKRAIVDIQSRDARPILCGGTGFWAQALLTEQSFPSVPPDPALRAALAHHSAPELFAELEALDPERAETIDRHNPVRLIRAIEIAKSQSPLKHELNPRPHRFAERFGRVTPTPRQNDSVGLVSSAEARGHSIQMHATIIILNPPFETLKANIKKRIDVRFDEQDMIGEVERLHEAGLSWERLDAFGLEYRWIARYLQGVIDEPTMRERLYFDIVHYAKRQLTWLRRWGRQDATLRWITRPEDV